MVHFQKDIGEGNESIKVPVLWTCGGEAVKKTTSSNGVDYINSITYTNMNGEEVANSFKPGAKWWFEFQEVMDDDSDLDLDLSQDNDAFGDIDDLPE